MLCFIAILCSLLCLAAHSASLESLVVTGTLPTRANRKLPLVPPLDLKGKTETENYHTWLDFAMDRFTLEAEALAPGVLSKLTMNGVAIPSRVNLTGIEIDPGEQKIFSLAVTAMSTRTYTLIVERRVGTSTELLDLKPITGTLGVPYNPGELQDLFEVNQSFYKDYFEVEYVKADDGQRVSCSVVGALTAGVASAPSGADLASHPKRFAPSLEQLNNETAEDSYDPTKGPVVHCSAPIDTWRQIMLALTIVSADGNAQRQVRLVVTRNGCAMGSFYYQGHCRKWCPSFHYEQRFNWRCGLCGEHCEFCEYWAHCTRCQPDTSLRRYELQNDGTCEARRVHAYKVYYDLAKYLAVSCGVLLAIYVFACLVWLCRRICCAAGEDDDPETAQLLDGNATNTPFGGKLDPRFMPAE